MMNEFFPNDWDSKRLNELGESYSGLKSKTKADFIEEGNAKFITYRNINKNYFVDENDLSPVVIEESENQNAVQKGDVLFTVSSETPEEVAFSSVMKNNIEDLYLNSFSFGYRFNNYYKVEPEFYAYYFRGNYFRKVVFPLAQGSTRYNISRNELLKLHVPIPPIEEQQKIAAILSSVDEAIEKTEQIIEQTEKVKKGLMQELLTKGIGHTEFKDTPVGKIPEEWEVLNFNDVFDRITTKNEVDNQNVLTISGEHGLISQLEYFNKSVSSKNLRNYIYLEKGDFAYNKSYSNGYPLGAIKRLERYDVGVVSTLYICFRLKESYIDGFYKYYFDSPYWHRQVYSIAPEGGRSHGLLNVGVRDFFEILIPVPPIEEQEKINNTIYSIDQKIIKENNRLINLSNIKKGLMQELLTGKKRVKIDDSEEILS